MLRSCLGGRAPQSLLIFLKLCMIIRAQGAVEVGNTYRDNSDVETMGA